MSAWIGPLGSLIEFKCPSAVDVSSEDANVYFRGLGGAVSVTRIGTRPRPRVWAVQVGAARPDQVAALEGLAAGEWGAGPFVFIPPAAETLNLLGRADALCLGNPGNGYRAGTPGTPVLTTEGPAGGAYVSATAGTVPDGAIGVAPVIPGRPVTGKAWVQPSSGATSTLALGFYTATGSPLTTTPAVSTTVQAGAFLHTTAVAPAGAAYASLIVSASTVTRPQITWTTGPHTWKPSAASTSTTLSPLSAGVRRATGRTGEEQITDHPFTVTELTP